MPRSYKKKTVKKKIKNNKCSIKKKGGMDYIKTFLWRQPPSPIHEDTNNTDDFSEEQWDYLDAETGLNIYKRDIDDIFYKTSKNYYNYIKEETKKRKDKDLSKMKRFQMADEQWTNTHMPDDKDCIIETDQGKFLVENGLLAKFTMLGYHFEHYGKDLPTNYNDSTSKVKENWINNAIHEIKRDESLKIREQAYNKALKRGATKSKARQFASTHYNHLSGGYSDSNTYLSKIVTNFTNNNKYCSFIYNEPIGKIHIYNTNHSGFGDFRNPEFNWHEHGLEKSWLASQQTFFHIISDNILDYGKIAVFSCNSILDNPMNGINELITNVFQRDKLAFVGYNSPGKTYLEIIQLTLQKRSEGFDRRIVPVDVLLNKL